MVWSEIGLISRRTTDLFQTGLSDFKPYLGTG